MHHVCDHLWCDVKYLARILGLKGSDWWFNVLWIMTHDNLQYNIKCLGLKLLFILYLCNLNVYKYNVFLVWMMPSWKTNLSTTVMESLNLCIPFNTCWLKSPIFLHSLSVPIVTFWLHFQFKSLATYCRTRPI